MMTKEDVLCALRVSLADVSAAVDWPNIQLSDHLVTDLGFDSLTMMLVVIKIEDLYDIEIPDRMKFETVNDVCEFLADIL